MNNNQRKQYYRVGWGYLHHCCHAASSVTVSNFPHCWCDGFLSRGLIMYSNFPAKVLRVSML